MMLLLAAALTAAAQSGSLRGIVTDETGAVLPVAVVTLRGPSGTQRTTAGPDGAYSFFSLRPGLHTVEAFAPKLALPRPARVQVGAGTTTLHLQLRVQVTQERVTIQESAATPGVSTDGASNGNSVVIRGKDLDALGDNFEDLAA
ncbi:MAG: carboxypeptidase regulatory-like domain-containing protein, partial [Acidobacteria bacterium]|nr:carboxypeptidase regulatory-like domain-containing protein [Acidobacteriota bacterium]